MRPLEGVLRAGHPETEPGDCEGFEPRRNPGHDDECRSEDEGEEGCDTDGPPGWLSSVESGFGVDPEAEKYSERGAGHRHDEGSRSSLSPRDPCAPGDAAASRGSDDRQGYQVREMSRS